MKQSPIRGYLTAVFSIAVWSSTYISTKILVRTFSPLEISLVRFSVALVLMITLAPPRKRPFHWKNEIRIAAAGLSGIFLYYFLENLAAQHTYASNVAVIVTTIPLWTGLAGPILYREEKFSPKIPVAFLLSMAGMIILLSGSGQVDLSWKGDLAALGAALCFALYTLLLRSVDPNIPTLTVTRKTLTYGWIVIVGVSAATGNIPRWADIVLPANIGHFLFLGTLASAICFWSWANAVRDLGAVKASQFIYLVPFIATSLSVVLLHEPLTPPRVAGMALIVGGVIISQVNLKAVLRKKITS